MSKLTTGRSAFIQAIIASGLVVLSVFAGSLGFRNLDIALIPYLLAVVIAVFGIVYRCSVWLQRPPAKMYWKPMGKLLVTHPGSFLRLLFRNLFFQKFIYARGINRWIGHLLIAVGCILAFCVTIPLTFGWFTFVLQPGSMTTYETHLFGFNVLSFQLDSIVAFMLFHILVFCSLFVIIGAIVMLKRRLTEVGLISTQTFEDDLLPLLLLVAVAATGLGIAYDYMFLDGKIHQFMSVIHAVTVIAFLAWIPYSKFFHILQRPMQLGVNIYKMEGENEGMTVCTHTGEAFAPKRQIDDLKGVTSELGFDFTLKGGNSHLDYSPEGKRSLLAEAHLKAREDAGSFFG